jgi:dTDP-glucose 4,6-dehydratase
MKFMEILNQGAHTESDLLHPSNPYSATKAAADQLVLAWARTYDLPYIIVRPTNNYGIGQYVEKLIPKSCKYLT